MSRDLIHNLKSLRGSRTAGAVPAEVKEKMKASIMEAIRHEDISFTRPLYDRVAYMRWMFGDMLVRPVAMGAMMMVLAIGGWMTSVNAATNSLPGETLYHVKLANEQIRLRLATVDRKAVLHTEFAQRRLNEAIAIKSTDEPGRRDLYKVTLDAYKNEMARATDNLKALQQVGEQKQIADVATQIDKKIDEIKPVVSGQMISDVPPDGESIRDVTKNTSNSVVDVLVETHETSEQPEVVEENVQATFVSEYNDILERQTFDLGRVSVLLGTLEYHSDYTFLDATVLKQLESDLKSATADAGVASSLAAAGGYRTAFELLRAVDVKLIEIETKIAELEFKVIEVRTPKPIVIPETTEESADEVEMCGAEDCIEETE